MPQKPSATATRQQNREIAAISARLLAHYWTAEELAPVRQVQIEDWIEDLREFPIECIAEACREYRRGPLRSHRPIPGDIRALCIAAEIAEREAQRQTKRLAGPVDLDAWARSLGWESYLQRQDAIAAQKQRELDGDWNHPERNPDRARPPSFKSLAEALGVKATEESAA